jgi:hypothetical protein
VLTFTAAFKIPIVGVGSVEMKIVDDEALIARCDDHLSVAIIDGGVQWKGPEQTSARSPNADHVIIEGNDTLTRKNECTFDVSLMPAQGLGGRRAVRAPQPQRLVPAPRQNAPAGKNERAVDPMRMPFEGLGGRRAAELNRVIEAGPPPASSISREAWRTWHEYGFLVRPRHSWSVPGTRQRVWTQFAVWAPFALP